MNNLGKAWVVLEESLHSNEKRLVAVLSPRKTTTFVAEYVEQVYVDNFASFNEKIAFKKNKKSSPFKMERYANRGSVIRHGHDPMFNAYYAHRLECNGDNLIFHYQVYKGDIDNIEVSECTGEVSIA